MNLVFLVLVGLGAAVPAAVTFDTLEANDAPDAFVGFRVSPEFAPMNFTFEFRQDPRSLFNLIVQPSLLEFLALAQGNMTEYPAFKLSLVNAFQHFFDWFSPWTTVSVDGLVPMCDKVLTRGCLPPSLPGVVSFLQDVANASNVLVLPPVSFPLSSLSLAVEVHNVTSSKAVVKWSYLPPSVNATRVVLVLRLRCAPYNTSCAGDTFIQQWDCPADMVEYAIGPLQPRRNYSIEVRGDGFRFDAVGTANFTTADGVFPVDHPILQLSTTLFENAFVFRCFYQYPWPGDVVGLQYRAIDTTLATPDLKWYKVYKSPGNPDLDFVAPAPDVSPLIIMRIRNLLPNTLYNLTVLVITVAGVGRPVSFAAVTRPTVPLAPSDTSLSCPENAKTVLGCVMRWMAPARAVLTGYEIARGVNLSAGQLGTIVHASNNTNVTQWVVDLADTRTTFAVRALSSYGVSPFSATVIFAPAIVPSSSSSNKNLRLISGILAAGFGVLLLVVIVLVIRRRQSQAEQGVRFPPPDRWEVVRSGVVVERELGAGQFGVVLAGFVSGLPTHEAEKTVQVAIKQCAMDAKLQEKREFLAECALMKAIPPHENVLGLLGCCLQREPLMLLLPFAELGDLNSLLRKQVQNGFPMSVELRLQYAVQIASGMRHVSSLNIIHRDLATRNVLVTAGGRTVKVADFGLARRLAPGMLTFTQREPEVMPVRWLAPEALAEGTYSLATDIWAFGVTLYEIWADGAMPYANMNNEEVCRAVVMGHRLTAPTGTSLALSSIIGACMQPRRPSFQMLNQALLNLHDDTVLAASASALASSSSSSLASASAATTAFAVEAQRRVSLASNVFGPSAVLSPINESDSSSGADGQEVSPGAGGSMQGVPSVGTVLGVSSVGGDEIVHVTVSESLSTSPSDPVPFSGPSDGALLKSTFVAFGGYVRFMPQSKDGSDAFDDGTLSTFSGNYGSHQPTGDFNTPLFNSATPASFASWSALNGGTGSATSLQVEPAAPFRSSVVKPPSSSPSASGANSPLSTVDAAETRGGDGVADDFRSRPAAGLKEPIKRGSTVQESEI